MHIITEGLQEKNVMYEYIDAEDMADLTKKYDVMSVPTLIELKDDGFNKIVNASNIISHFEDLK